jgi:hypothetical protein
MRCHIVEFENEVDMYSDSGNEWAVFETSDWVWQECRQS